VPPAFFWNGLYDHEMEYQKSHSSKIGIDRSWT